MRLKQLLGIILVAVASASAAGPVSQLAGVQVQQQDQASVLTVRANGPFTHTEYRPTDNLMLLDLAGVDVARQDGDVHPVPGTPLQSYRVVGYRSPAGAQVARIELKLVPGAKANVTEIKDGVEVRVSGAGVSTAKSDAARPNRTTEPSHVSRISNIAVARGKDGINIEVTGSASIVAKTMKLTSPDRIVVDIPNSILQGHSREIPVNNGDVKEVRAAHYQTEPPTTRIVVDLASMHDFELVPAGNKLMLKVKSISAAPQPAPAATEVVAQQSPVNSKPAETKTAAAELLVPPTGEKPVQPAQAIPAAATSAPQSDEKKTTSAVQSRGEQAAAHFVKPAPSPVFNPQRPASEASSSLAAGPALVNAAIQQQQERPAAAAGAPAATSCTSGHYTGAPLNLDLKDLDIKDFFRLIHEISGLNVVLDPSVKGVVTIDVTDIPWDQALAIVLRNNALECELQGNVLRIATLDTLRAEADARRAQQDALALQVPRQNFTRYLSYAHAKDTVPIVKKFLSARGDVIADDRSNAVIIEDIPATLPKVDELLTRLDKKSPEVEIEARVVAATRNFARDIGTQLGFGWGNKPTAIGGGTGTPGPLSVALPGGVIPAFITTPGDITKIPLFSNLPATGPTSGIAFTNGSSIYRLDFVLTMAENRGLVKILSRPRVITQNNIQALVRQGSRIPVVTQAQLGGPPTVTYVDSFLRLQVTPQITNENTIFLQVDVENTTPDFTRVTGAQLNPTLNTQQTTTQVLVSDGQTVVIGGVIQTQNSIAIAQVPLLGSIPVLGNLFKHTAVTTTTQELIFFITPKIIQT